MKKILLAVFIIGAWLTQCKAQKKQYVFATYTYSANNRLQNLTPLTNLLSENSGLNIKAVSYPTVQALINAIRNDSVDFAMMNTSGYLVLQRNHPGIVFPLVNLDMGGSVFTNYGGCLIAGKQTGIMSVKDLQPKGKKYSLALVNSSSTSGNLVPRLLLNSTGITSAEASLAVDYSGTHKKVVEDVISGRADIGGCGCSEIDSARKYLDFDARAIVIDSFNDIPLGPVVYNKNLDTSITKSILNCLLAIHQNNKATFENFCNGWTEFKQAKQFKQVADKDYDSFRKMFGNNTQLWKLIE
ncbi:MAG TPA: PhnD/SsuA/transferrin family substrate-binding protein [Chitinophagaceae bacterium]